VMDTLGVPEDEQDEFLDGLHEDVMGKKKPIQKEKEPKTKWKYPDLDSLRPSDN